MLESDLAKPVMNWLDSRGFVPYGEVAWMYRAIDVVGISEGSVECVEMKLSLSKHVLYQAHIASLCGLAWCAVATEPRNLSKASAIGVGVLRVHGGDVEVLLEPVHQHDTSKL